ncbi:Os11g0657850 [Oryza sativa Japonica Group]|uniref:Os11g0657850 protein n=1 Tax=Oryza sativa subsp. japonica TaxID=39947 RepID=A0A0P0Y5G4_ORYSJ|nr:hypothetical protein EE612_056963 [Oryza sativa]BAT15119.1 Os11g0657850 [Oryza sativa Japonica Group]
MNANIPLPIKVIYHVRQNFLQVRILTHRNKSRAVELASELVIHNLSKSRLAQSSKSNNGHDIQLVVVCRPRQHADQLISGLFDANKLCDILVKSKDPGIHGGRSRSRCSSCCIELVPCSQLCHLICKLLDVTDPFGDLTASFPFPDQITRLAKDPLEESLVDRIDKVAALCDTHDKGVDGILDGI